MTKLYARQGDLVITKIEKVEGDVVKSKDVVFAGDSSGHRHRLMGTALVNKNERRTQFSIVEPMQLVHEKSDGHSAVSLEPGAYEVRSLRERGDGNDRAVED